MLAHCHRQREFFYPGQVDGNGFIYWLTTSAKIEAAATSNLSQLQRSLMNSLLCREQTYCRPRCTRSATLSASNTQTSRRRWWRRTTEAGTPSSASARTTWRLSSICTRISSSCRTEKKKENLSIFHLVNGLVVKFSIFIDEISWNKGLLILKEFYFTLYDSKWHNIMQVKKNKVENVF